MFVSPHVLSRLEKLVDPMKALQQFEGRWLQLHQLGHNTSQKSMKEPTVNHRYQTRVCTTQVLSHLEKQVDPMKALQQFGDGYNYTHLVTAATLADKRVHDWYMNAVCPTGAEPAGEAG